ncbi:MAG: hypothetical protein KDA25_00735, partial [Phycisphaerales bacterium]|nr:hypothetical protein [Phycisphaerales bacterium]
LRDDAARARLVGAELHASRGDRSEALAALAEAMSLASTWDAAEQVRAAAVFLACDRPDAARPRLVYAETSLGDRHDEAAQAIRARIVVLRGRLAP